MIIEFPNTAAEVQDWIIGYIRSKLMHLHKKHKKMLRVQVILKKISDTDDEGKVCEINLIIDDYPIFTSSNAHSYEQAAKQAIYELSLKIEEYQSSKMKELPDALPGNAVDLSS